MPSVLRSKETKTSLMQLEVFFTIESICYIMQKMFLEIFCSQTVILDLSQTSVSKNERNRVFWYLKKLHQCGWEYHLTWGINMLKTSVKKKRFSQYVVELVTFDLFQTGCSNNQKLWIFWGPNERKPQVMQSKILCYSKYTLTYNFYHQLYCRFFFLKLWYLISLKLFSEKRKNPSFLGLRQEKKLTHFKIIFYLT